MMCAYPKQKSDTENSVSDLFFGQGDQYIPPMPPAPAIAALAGKAHTPILLRIIHRSTNELGFRKYTVNVLYNPHDFG